MATCGGTSNSCDARASGLRTLSPLAGAADCSAVASRTKRRGFSSPTPASSLTWCAFLNRCLVVFRADAHTCCDQVDGLLLDPDHPRKDTDEEIKAAVQRDFAECIQQISLFPPGCKALQAAPGVVEALDALVEQAWSEEAKDCARGALMQLTDRWHPHTGGGGGGGVDALHIMMSCECTPRSALALLLADDASA
jgi:hypothetical protein